MKADAFTVRLSEAEAAEFQRHREEMELRSNSEVVSSLLSKTTSDRNALEDTMYTLLDRLADRMERRLQSLNTMLQLNLALNDAFMSMLSQRCRACPRS